MHCLEPVATPGRSVIHPAIFNSCITRHELGRAQLSLTFSRACRSLTQTYIIKYLFSYKQHYILASPMGYERTRAISRNQLCYIRFFTGPLGTAIMSGVWEHTPMFRCLLQVLQSETIFQIQGCVRVYRYSYSYSQLYLIDPFSNQFSIVKSEKKILN